MSHHLHDSLGNCFYFFMSPCGKFDIKYSCPVAQQLCWHKENQTICVIFVVLFCYVQFRNHDLFYIYLCNIVMRGSFKSSYISFKGRLFMWNFTKMPCVFVITTTREACISMRIWLNMTLAQWFPTFLIIWLMTNIL